MAYALGNRPAPSPASGSAPATRSSSPRWSTTPTSCRGSCSRSAPARRCKWFGVTDDGRLDLSNIDELITERTKIVSFAHQSERARHRQPGRRGARRAHEVGALVMLDASQSVPHHAVDVAALGADFVAFTGHKMLGPTGIGVLWGRRELLEAMPPFLGGGEMIETVSMDHSTYAPGAAQVRGGHPADREAVGLGAAIDYLTAIGMDAIAAHERELTGLRAGRAAARSPACGSSARHGRGPRGGDDLVHARRASTRTTSARSSTTSRHRGPGRPPLRPAALPAVRSSGDHPGVVLPVHHDGARSTPWSPAWSTCGRSSAR